MIPTIRTVLAGSAVQAGKPEVLSGSSRLDRPVRWVHVSEVREVADLLEGDELLLSTGLAMRGTADEATDYVSALIGAGAAGLIVELGEHLPSIPPAVLELVRSQDFPLVALHRQARFVLITEEVHRGIVADRFDFVRFAQDVHETFTALSLDGVGVDELVRAGAEMAGSSFVLEDLNRRVVAFHAIGRPADGLLADWERRSRLCPRREGTGLAGLEGWLTTVVGTHGHEWGRLVVPNPMADQQRLGMLVERVAQAVELSRMIERDQQSVQLQAQSGFLSELLDGRLGDESTALTRARALGLAPGAAYVGAAVQADGASEAETVHRAQRRLGERVARALAASRQSAIAGVLGDDQVVLLLSVPPRSTEDDVLTAFAGALRADAGRDPVTIGVGTAEADLLASSRSLRTAQHVARVAHEALTPGPPWFRQADIRLHGLIAQLHDDPRVQAFVEAELDPLLAHEARHGGGLLDLLRQFLAAGGNKSLLARTSHRSRPALYAKLAQVEEILGVRLDDPSSQLSLGVAMLAHDHAR
ncbi:PucR family transcriptional regulator ligand-binding domain-containing protein [Aeromicrobium sp. NPDC092404]|uniref:PucR family transcriptional regulator n=1 Tax=Aeromicrobium sp. NPDC092404 TaxID=3154976 RepID=UPI003418DEE5